MDETERKERIETFAADFTNYALEHMGDGFKKVWNDFLQANTELELTEAEKTELLHDCQTAWRIARTSPKQMAKVREGSPESFVHIVPSDEHYDWGKDGW